VLERFETSAEKVFFLSLCATVVLGVVVAVASVRTQIGVASPGFVVWQNLIVPAIGAIGPSPEAAAVPSYASRSTSFATSTSGHRAGAGPTRTRRRTWHAIARGGGGRSALRVVLRLA
jgi:hypothetical protein